MKIFKTTIKYAVFYLLFVALIAINSCFYFYNNQGSKTYNENIALFRNTLDLQKNKLVQQNDLEDQFFSIKTVPTPTVSDQKNIDFLNSGTELVDNSQPNAIKDCSSIERPWRRITDSNTCAFQVTSAVGDLKLLIVQYVAPDIDMNDSKIQGFLNTLNSEETISINQGELDNAFETFNLYSEKNGYSQISREAYLKQHQTSFIDPSYQYIKKFFEYEANVFGADFSLTVDKSQPIQLKELPNFSKEYKDQSQNINKAQTFFLNKLIESKIDVSDYDAVSLIVFANHDSYFRSFALPSIRANIDFVTIESDSSSDSDQLKNYSLDTEGILYLISHETAHDFGASDQYIEDYKTGFTKGCVDGAYDEYVSKDRSEMSLMCGWGSIRYDWADRSKWTSSYKSLINKITAQEFKWIK
ncbi:MAG: hypothetical protein WCO23_00090 [bacterium]